MLPCILKIMAPRSETQTTRKKKTKKRRKKGKATKKNRIKTKRKIRKTRSKRTPKRKKGTHCNSIMPLSLNFCEKSLGTRLVPIQDSSYFGLSLNALDNDVNFFKK